VASLGGSFPATAVEFNAILLTGDPEIEALEGEPHLKVEWLPRKP
jgi:hypothetical protein